MKILASIVLTAIVLLLNINPTLASSLTERIQEYPNWLDRPNTTPAKGDLFYPDWMEGKWQVTSTLIDSQAPLAPQIVTPGYQENDRYLNLPLEFTVKFIRKNINGVEKIASDRADNGKNIAVAYLGEKAVLSVKNDPKNPNRQITKLKDNKQLISIVTDRASETPDRNNFIATEIVKQIFRNAPEIYLNTVETTASYQSIDRDNIIAEQITAIYLSPKDPNYFKAIDRPVTLYRYNLKLKRVSME